MKESICIVGIFFSPLLGLVGSSVPSKSSFLSFSTRLFWLQIFLVRLVTVSKCLKQIGNKHWLYKAGNVKLQFKFKFNLMSQWFTLNVITTSPSSTNLTLLSVWHQACQSASYFATL